MAGQYRFKDSNGNIVAQISASVGGVISFSGSQVDFSQANTISLGEVQMAGTASNALLLDGFDSQAFAFTSSIHPFTASIAGTNTFTSSATARLNSIETISASNISRLNSIETITASVNTLNTTQTSRLDSLEAKTGSLATTGSNTFIGTQTITGSLYISSDLIVQGSSSLQNITASAVSIGTNIINLNTANPAIRYAGLSIGDSGSIGSSGSFLYDSVQDEFIFVHRGANTTVTSSVLLMGPQTYDSIGNETYLTTNRLPKGAGNEHLIDSNISDTGTLVTINSVTASFTGSVGIGTTTPTSKLDIYGASGNGNPIFKVIGTSAADSFNYAGTILNPSLGSGRNYALFIGKALNTKDSAYIGFNHSGTDGSDSNFVNIGHFNNDYMLNIKGNGFVGIGTTNPTQALSVSGSISLGNLSAALNFTGGGNARFLEIGSAGDALLVTHASGFGVGYFGYQSADDRLVVACDNGAGANKIDFIVNAGGTTGGGTNNLSGVLPAMRINSSGSVGIGTTSIASSDVRLDVYKSGSAGWNPRLLVRDQNFASFLGVYNQKAGVFAHTSALDGWADLYVNTIDGGFGAGNNGKVIFGGMCILANGNVGIGVTDPAWKLHIQGTTGTSIQDALMTLKNTAASNTTGILFVNSGNTSSFNDLAGIYAKIQSGSAKGYLGFYTRNSDGSNADVNERLRISAEGYVGIGITNPSRMLQVKSNSEGQTAGISGATYGIRFDNGGTNSPSMSTIHGTDSTLVGSYQSIMLNGLDVRFGTSDTERMRIASNGNVGIGTTNAGGKLTISRATEAQDYQLQLRVVGGIADGNYDGITFTQGAAGATPLGSIRMKYASSGYPGFGIYTRSASAAETERLSISNAGQVTTPFQPASKAGLSSSTSFGANSTIVFNDTSGNHFNIGGYYNTSNGMFTAPVAGVYIFSACVIYQSMPNGQPMDDAFYIYRNSTLVTYSFRRAEYEAGYTGNGGYYVDHANTLLNLAAGDTVSIRNNRALDVHGNTNYCFFYGYMLG